MQCFIFLPNLFLYPITPILLMLLPFQSPRSEIFESSLTFPLLSLMCHQVLSLNTSTEIFPLALIQPGNNSGCCHSIFVLFLCLLNCFPASRFYPIQSVLHTTPSLIFIKCQFDDSFLISKYLQEAVVESPRKQEDPRRAHIPVRIGAVNVVRRRYWFRTGFPEE